MARRNHEATSARLWVLGFLQAAFARRRNGRGRRGAGPSVSGRGWSFCWYRPSSWTASWKTWPSRCVGGRLKAPAQEHTTAGSQKRSRTWSHKCPLGGKGSGDGDVVRRRCPCQSDSSAWDLVEVEGEAISCVAWAIKVSRVQPECKCPTSWTRTAGRGQVSPGRLSLESWPGSAGRRDGDSKDASEEKAAGRHRVDELEHGPLGLVELFLQFAQAEAQGETPVLADGPACRGLGGGLAPRRVQLGDSVVLALTGSLRGRPSWPCGYRRWSRRRG